MPDEALFEAAANDELRTAEQLEAQARRMMRLEDGSIHPRTRKTMRQFVDDWLGLPYLYQQKKVYKSTRKAWTSELRNSLASETRLFFEHVFWESTLDDVLTANYSFLNSALTAHYGIEAAGDEEGFVKTTLPSDQRQGLLTQGFMLTRSAPTPIMRGTYLLRRLMCQKLEDPDDDITTELPPSMPGEGTRERLKKLEDNPSCSSCHIPMHGVGFGLRHYNEIGQWRPTRNNEPIDASGWVTAAEDQAYDGAVELSDVLHDSRLVEKCLIRNLWRFAYGRGEEEQDEVMIEALYEASASNEGRFEEVMIALVRSGDFRSRPKLLK